LKIAAQVRITARRILGALQLRLSLAEMFFAAAWTALRL